MLCSKASAHEFCLLFLVFLKVFDQFGLDWIANLDSDFPVA
jgi:hypothetical protein